MNYTVEENGVVRDMTPEEIELMERDRELMNAEVLRVSTLSAQNDRNARLAETDWLVIRKVEDGIDIPTEWSEYRQALRDITSHENWPWLNLEDWPTKPE